MKFGKLVGTGLVVVALAGGGYWLLHQDQPAEKTQTTTKQPAKQQSSSEKKVYPVTIKPGSEEATLLMVVNKKHPLPADYNPYNGGLSPRTETAKDQLIAAMKQAGFDVGDTVSGYRGYDYQKTLYDGYVASEGQAEADAVSARPGYSEHQSA